MVYSQEQSGTDLEKKTEQEKQLRGWKKKLDAYFTVNQYSYSNWSKGGVDFFSWSSRVVADFKFQGNKWAWELTHLMEFGQSKQGDQQVRNSKDRIRFDGAVMRSIKPFFKYYLGISALTQFTKGYDYQMTPSELQSDFWDPVYLTQSAGVQLQVQDIFESKIGVGFQEVITDRFVKYSDNSRTDNIEKYSVKEGIESKTKFDMQVLENLHIRSTLNMFSSFAQFQEADVFWDTLFSSKVTDIISFSFNVQMIYDNDVLDKVQLKEELGIALMFNVI